MLEYTDVRAIAERSVDPGTHVDDAYARELRDGWFFPFICTSEPLVGCNGIIINKTTGKVLRLGSAYSDERDIEMYEKGYQFERYDLVILEILDKDATLDALLQLHFVSIEPKYDRGTVWRIPRPLTRADLALRIAQVPYVFGDVGLYGSWEVLEAARALGSFRFLALEYTP